MLPIGGLQKFSLIDYPGKVAAVIFTQGCDFRCPFCHNPELVLPERFKAVLSEEEVLAFLEKRRGQLSGIVVTGGEPTIHKRLAAFLAKVKALGFPVKLDTNGNHPEHLQALIDQKLVDYVAMDVKAPKAKYDQLSGVKVDIGNIQKSIDLLIASGIDHHFRTTVVRKFISPEDLSDIRAWLDRPKKFLVQEFRAHVRLVDETLKDSRVYNDEEFRKIQETFEKK